MSEVAAADAAACAACYMLSDCLGARWQLVFFLVDDYGFADVGYHADMYGTDPDPCNSNVSSWGAPCNMSGGAKNMRMETPNLDRLSAAGIRLENYYIQPVCSPTRATLLTGRYVFHHGVHVPFIDSSRSTLPLNETTLAERLRSAGYRTHMIGKVRTLPSRQRRLRTCLMILTDMPAAHGHASNAQWHLGFRTPAHAPNERGFDSFYGYYAGSQE
jgi:arylsulfatase A-like enzyme